MRVVVTDGDAVEVVNREDSRLQQMEQAYPGAKLLLSVWYEPEV